MSSLGERAIEPPEATAPRVTRRERFVRAGITPTRSRTRDALRMQIDEGAAPMVVAERDSILRQLLILADVAAATLALLFAVSVVGDGGLQAGSLLLLPLVVVTSRLMGLYDRDEIVLAKTTLNEGPALFHLATLFTMIVFLGQGAFVEGGLGTAGGFALWAGFLVACGGGRSLMRHVAVARAETERCLVIGEPDRLLRVGEKLRHGWALNAEIVRSIPLSELPATDETRATVAALVRAHDAHRVIVASGDLDSDRLLAIIREAKALGVKVSVQPRLLDVIGSAVEFEDVHGDVFLGLRRFGLKASDLRTKRAMDIVGSSLLLVVAAPLILLAAIAIKLDSPGPVFFRQERVGRNGRRFLMWKLRTMVEDAEERQSALMAFNEAHGGLFKMKADPRVTRVGRLLRRTALDELPQLFNVLYGQMSLVGPRPLVVWEDERIAGWHRRRLHLVPGMTGMWQVLGSARIPLQDMVALDYLYIVNWSVWNDLQILLRTIGFVLRGRGL